MNIIKSFDDSESKKIFKNLLCSFSIAIDIKIVDIITTVDIIMIVDIIKVIFCNEMLVVMNDPLSLLTLT